MSRIPLRDRRFDLMLVAIFGGVLVAAALFSVNGNTVTVGGEEMGAACLTHRFLGIACPFCGMTRSFIALLHGDLGGSIAFHPAGAMLVAGAAITLGSIAVVILRRRPPISSRQIFLPAVQAVALFAVAIGGARMLF